MTVARVTKIAAASPKSFHEAIHRGIERASKTLRDTTGFHVLEEKPRSMKARYPKYRVTTEINFVIDE